jgi:hypothetical protein
MAAAAKVGCGVRLLLLVFLIAGLLAQNAPAKTFYLIVAGLGAEPDYDLRFSGLAKEAEKSLRGAGGDDNITTLISPASTKVAVRGALADITRSATARDSVVVLLIGHGSFDGVDYKFNLPGPDLSAAELADDLNKIPATRQLVVDTSSASGAALKPLERPGRVVVTATRDGAETNATVFARFWVEALHDNSADTDKNEVVTALEAFNFAQRKTAKFYEEQKRIATEHPVLSDASKASQFTVIRFGSEAASAADPAKKQLMATRDDLEAKIDALKQEKNTLAPELYKTRLTALLLQLAQTQQEIDK